MTDLVTLADIQTQLSAQAETRLSLDAAYRIAQQVQATYEADRTAKDATIDNLTQQVTALTNQTLAQGVAIANLTATRDALTDTASSLREQVDDLTSKLALGAYDVREVTR